MGILLKTERDIIMAKTKIINEQLFDRFMMYLQSFAHNAGYSKINNRYFIVGVPAKKFLNGVKSFSNTNHVIIEHSDPTEGPFEILRMESKVDEHD